MTISVIIPTYNREKLVQQAIDSVLHQTRPADEVIVVDDGSTDDTIELLRPHAAAGRIQLIRCEHTGMPGAARNRGVERAGGDYLAFLDSDDLWMQEKLAMQAAAVGKAGGAAGEAAGSGVGDDGPAIDQPVLVHTRERWNRDGKEVSQTGQRHRREGFIFADALKKCIIGPSTVLLRRDIYTAAGGFREDLPVAEDYELWLHITARYAAGYIDQPLIEKRAGHGEQLSEKWGAIEYFRLRALLDFLGYHTAMPAPPGLPVLHPDRTRSITGASRLPVDLLQQAEAELERKLRVFAKGAAKRGYTDITAWCDRQGWKQPDQG